METLEGLVSAVSGRLAPHTALAPRILVIDDNAAIHDDVRKILVNDSPAEETLRELETALFGDSPRRPFKTYRVDSAFQGEEGLECVRRAVASEDPYSVAFVDVRMPPGWDGIETIARLWQECPELQVVICSAYSDYSWTEIMERLGTSDSLLVLRKPFESVELHQMASALARKWALQREDREKLRRANEELQLSNARLREELAERARMEAQLRLAQKLESVGRLAAGVAHEINTPVQFANDSVQYVRDSVEALTALIGKYRAVTRAVLGHGDCRAAAQAASALEVGSDLDYLLEHVPKALDRSLDGLARVATIVRSLREFAHPDQRDVVPVDLNRAIMNALNVARNEYKSVADVETDLSQLPPVMCNPSDLNQVILNLIVNAAHAIGDVVRGTPEKGLIRIQTFVDGGMVVLAVGDTGTGIAPEIREQIFDPFFSTKDLGKGMGQGLTIAYSAVEKHGGNLTFETEVGKGTTFFVRLPVGVRRKTPIGTPVLSG